MTETQAPKLTVVKPTDPSEDVHLRMTRDIALASAKELRESDPDTENTSLASTLEKRIRDAQERIGKIKDTETVNLAALSAKAETMVADETVRLNKAMQMAEESRLRLKRIETEKVRLSQMASDDAVRQISALEKRIAALQSALSGLSVSVN